MYVVPPKTVRISPARTSVFATTPQLSAATSIPRTFETRSSSRRGMLLLQVHSLVHMRPMRFFHSQALICSSPVTFGTVDRRLLEVLVDDGPRSRLSAVSD